MKRILVSNDDGIDADGIRALAAALEAVGEVTVVAPEREQSAASHSLTLHKPLRIYERGPRRFAVSGTPTDCVNMAVHHIMPAPPDIVVSGINRGANLGDDVTYSGTVSAAMEGTLLGIPSVAFSQIMWRPTPFDGAARFAADLVRQMLERGAAGEMLPPDTLLNVNVPDLPWEAFRGVRWTVQGKRRFTKEQVVEKTDPRGRKYYWVGGSDLEWEGNPDSDHSAVTQGYISVTPVHLDLTNHDALRRLRDWRLDAGGRPPA
ncbi:MAG: 5'/3'-nucleotidase SurE [Nitrospirota bacterium]|nr:5'/3'-nucleotidase SurE [Nitrospirota bacterium]